ncbi:MAG: hypothetical protein GXO77_07900 [Calditrichaeota bacterium]|nr:hypothetical protein [Calditrichota bacterium]
MMASENVIYKLSRGGIPEEVSLSSMEWAVITQIDGNRDVAEIAQNLALSTREALQIVRSLIDKGLLQIVRVKKEEIEIVKESLFRKLEKILTKYIGPVATYVINDALMELNAERSNYRKNRVPELIELLSDEISDEKKKIQFQKEMLELLKGL